MYVPVFGKFFILLNVFSLLNYISHLPSPSPLPLPPLPSPLSPPPSPLSPPPSVATPSPSPTTQSTSCVPETRRSPQPRSQGRAYRVKRSSPWSSAQPSCPTCARMSSTTSQYLPVLPSPVETPHPSHSVSVCVCVCVCVCVYFFSQRLILATKDTIGKGISRGANGSAL